MTHIKHGQIELQLYFLTKKAFENIIVIINTK